MFQEEALHVVSTNAVDVAEHRAVEHCTDPLPLLLQPRQDKGLDYLQEEEAGPLVTTGSAAQGAALPLLAGGLTSCPSSARPAMEP